MMCVAKPMTVLLAVALLGGSSAMSWAQESGNGLRMETNLSVDDPATLSKISGITIGDDDTLPRPRRRNADEDVYAQQGVNAGAFLLFPSLELGSVVTSNVRQSSTKADADVAVRIKPQLRLESNWSRHSLTATASLEAEQYAQDKDIKSLDGDVQAAFRLDIRSTTRADFDVSYSAASLGIGNDELPAAATSDRLDHVLGAGVRLTHDFGGVEASLRTGAIRNIYGEVDLVGGGEEDNSDRDFTEMSVALRTSLKTGGKLQPFGEVAYVPRIYDAKRDRNGVKRSSHGVRLRAGVSLIDDALWGGELAAVLEHRNYADAGLDSATAPGLEANLTWRPTDLTRFEFNAGTRLSETVSLGDSAAITWSAGGRAIHSLRNNLDVYAGLQGAFERESGDTDITTTASLGLDWTLNPFLVFSTGYEGVFFNSATPGSDYVDHRVLTSIILRR